MAPRNNPPGAIQVGGQVYLRRPGARDRDEFLKLKLNPGDTIVIPDKTIKPSALRGVLDWTQLFSQLAFGVAAIHAVF